jgi:hypothetical protein
MKEIDKRIKALCEAKGITFKPWEYPRPWEIEDDEPCPYGPPSSAGVTWWPKLLALRAALKEELENAPE